MRSAGSIGSIIVILSVLFPKERQTIRRHEVAGAGRQSSGMDVEDVPPPLFAGHRRLLRFPPRLRLESQYEHRHRRHDLESNAMALQRDRSIRKKEVVVCASSSRE